VPSGRPDVKCRFDGFPTSSPRPLARRLPPLTRIFFSLSLLAVALLAANLALGWSTGDYNGTYASVVEEGESLMGRLRELHRRNPRPTRQIEEVERSLRALPARLAPLQDWATAHALAGITAALVTLLVNSIAVTYFIGTSRWCREVCEAYELDPQLAAGSEALKRRAFPWALGGMATILVVAVLGAAVHPGFTGQPRQAWVICHHVAALAGTAAIAWAFVVQGGYIAANLEVIQEILRRVQEIRAQRGLPTES
jgi:hypothetical protein